MKRPLSFLKSYQQHNYFLLGGTVLFLLFIYSNNIRKTIEYRQKYQYNLSSVQRAATATRDIGLYKTQLAGLQQTALKTYDREYLLSEITSFCKDNALLVRAFPESQKVVKNDYTIVTNELEVEGNYKEIVSLIYQIEQEKKLAAIGSTQFFLHKDRVSRQQKLRCKLVLRNLE